jgi:hypothetical protein
MSENQMKYGENNSNSNSNLMDFGQAIKCLKEGKKVARQGWNGKSMFLILNGGYEVAKENSRPDNHINEEFLESRNQTHLKIGKHIDMWTATNDLCVGWLASQTDMLSEDWVVVE